MLVLKNPKHLETKSLQQLWSQSKLNVKATFWRYVKTIFFSIQWQRTVWPIGRAWPPWVWVRGRPLSSSTQGTSPVCIWSRYDGLAMRFFQLFPMFLTTKCGKNYFAQNSTNKIYFTNLFVLTLSYSLAVSSGLSISHKFVEIGNFLTSQKMNSAKLIISQKSKVCYCKNVHKYFF